jgi:glycosyltransferase involved in cell wall biosynthesis
MKFSVIIPTHNRVVYLKEAILSVLNQQNIDLEIVVIDNASTDGTDVMMRVFESNSIVKYIQNEVNIGMIQNWSKALYEKCDGDWIMILSDDDSLIDDLYLSKAEKLIKNNDNMVLVHANRIVASETIEDRVSRNLPKICEGIWMFEHYLEDYQNMFTFVTGIFKKEIAYKVNAFKTFDVVGSDTMEFLKISLYGKVGFIDDFVAKYRIHEDNPYFRFGIDYILTTNIETFEAPYREARKLKIFEDKMLLDWKKRLITQYIESNLREILLKGNGNFNLLIEYIRKSLKLYPYCWFVFFKPKVIFRIFTYRFKK